MYEEEATGGRRRASQTAAMVIPRTKLLQSLAACREGGSHTLGSDKKTLPGPFLHHHSARPWPLNSRRSHSGTSSGFATFLPMCFRMRLADSKASKDLLQLTLPPVGRVLDFVGAVA